MYDRILVPVDLAHADKLTRALDTAVTLGKPNGATLIYVGVAPTVPGPAGRNPEEFATRLRAFADGQHALHGLPVDSETIVSHDPSIDLRDKLVQAARDRDVDLVVMATHVPGMADNWFKGNAAHVAQHAPMSVFVVR
ncbi:universal stress protein [Jannaschia rubra]|uniref:Universal stress protein G n=1 Tax=Jannaschia rubra TaxID=282197 RepID=A0A0M6XNF4_9RHOB|nr:universal stress protein [Jannaschia rubra]CTQ32117.1 Universal stress protein G [Jannaschia rubra]SFG37226.1 Nucleotide-binding universal stress protein, UspA family [Jannaschia rubra]